MMTTACNAPPGVDPPRLSYDLYPWGHGHYGPYGGRYVGENLMPALIELEAALSGALDDDAFMAEYHRLLAEYGGRPTPLYHARRLSEALGGGAVYLKREDLLHTGAHKLNNTIGQILLAAWMGKKSVIAETGAGQHGVATATTAAMMGLSCCVFMGVHDIERQAPNVSRMKLLGAEVVPVETGSGTLKDAMNEAMRCWVGEVRDTFYVIGSVAGPHPYPLMVREFQKVIGAEAREQILQQTGRLPDRLIACIGGGSNAMGLFYRFLGDPVGMIGVEAAGHGIASGRHAATLGAGSVGVLHGSKSYVLQDAHGQITEAHSISAGLDYPGVGPEHALLKDLGTVRYTAVDDAQALHAFYRLSALEGIIPALESAHAVAEAMKEAPRLTAEQSIIVNLSGRGDKDLAVVLEQEKPHA